MINSLEMPEKKERNPYLPELERIPTVAGNQKKILFGIKGVRMQYGMRSKEIISILLEVERAVNNVDDKKYRESIANLKLALEKISN